MPAIIGYPRPSIVKSEFDFCCLQCNEVTQVPPPIFVEQNWQKWCPTHHKFTENAHTTQHSVRVKKDTKKILSYGQKYLIRCMMGMTMIWMMGINPMMPVANRLLFELEWIKCLSIHNLNAGFFEREKKSGQRSLKAFILYHNIIYYNDH